MSAISRSIFAIISPFLTVSLSPTGIDFSFNELGPVFGALLADTLSVSAVRDSDST
jgi:hypothetical protein